jgi:hypothetical protein
MHQFAFELWLEALLRAGARGKVYLQSKEKLAHI